MIYAGFWVRFGAHIIDFFLLSAVEILFTHVVALPFDLSPFSQQILDAVVTIPLSVWYYCSFQTKHGQTVGKRFFSITVIDEHSGKYLSQKQAVLRLLGYLASYIVIGCGFLMAAFHPQKKGLHDIIAGTVSVRRGNSWKAGTGLIIGLALGLFVAFKIYGPKLIHLIAN